MSSTIVKNGGVERIPIKRAFNGFIISIASILDVAGPVTNVFPLASRIDPFKVNVSLRNLDSNRDCWNISLGRLVQYLNRYTLEGVAFVQMQKGSYANSDLGVEGYANGANILSSLDDYSFKFDHTYDGNYEFVIEMKDAVPVGSKISSFISVIPEWSDEPMKYETIIDDVSLDKVNLNLELGSGVEEVILQRDLSITNDEEENPTYASFVSNIKRASYNSSSGRMEEYNQNDLRVLTNSFFDNRVQSEPKRMPMLVVHDDEINSDMRVVIETYVPNVRDYALFTTLLINENLSASESMADQRDEAVISKMRYNS